MLARREQSPALRSLLALLSLGLLASCSNSEALGNFVNADPQLQATQTQENSQPNPTPQDPQEIATLNLPEELPPEIPLYPQVDLVQTDPELNNITGNLLLRSPDNIRAIADYYQSQFQLFGWDILQPFTLDRDGNSQSTIASKNNIKITVSLAQLVDNENNTSQTAINIAYEPFIANLANADPELTTESEVTPDTSANAIAEPEVAPKPTETTKTTKTVTNFVDFAEVREQIQQAVIDVAALGILTPQSPDSLEQFAPNELVTRRDYVRWLVAANNKFHDDSPGKKIHLTKNASQKAFKDIDTNDPDFGEIQGLAEAGLIPSILTGSSNNVLFRPDATLTREDLISWKVPLDVRAALSKASIETIEETWGFQDAAKIDSQAIRALFSDYQNGDLANVRRVFGYTTLFQPKRGVTRAEAAASLWYFGYQNDGISAEELLNTSI
ncbi:MAG: S-layer homology domain-containing protein [Cyanobacteria bacterium P01_F01_bin.143]